MKIKKLTVILLGLLLCLTFTACAEEEEPSVFARTKGIWRIDGEEGTAFIQMDGEGNFEAYYADGTLEFSGYLEYVDEFGDGNGRYDMYDLSGELIDGFYFHEENAFHMGNYGDFVYILDNE